jgi:hypothetical protein
MEVPFFMECFLINSMKDLNSQTNNNLHKAKT